VASFIEIPPLSTEISRHQKIGVNRRKENGRWTGTAGHTT